MQELTEWGWSQFRIMIKIISFNNMLHIINFNNLMLNYIGILWKYKFNLKNISKY